MSPSAAGVEQLARLCSYKNGDENALLEQHRIYEELEMAYQKHKPWIGAEQHGWRPYCTSPSATLFRVVDRYLQLANQPSTWQWIQEPNILGFSILLHEVAELNFYIKNGWNPFHLKEQIRHYDECHALALLVEYEFLRFAWKAGSAAVPFGAFLEFNPLVIGDVDKEWDARFDYKAVQWLQHGVIAREEPTLRQIGVDYEQSMGSLQNWLRVDFIYPCRVFEIYKVIGWYGLNCSPYEHSPQRPGCFSNCPWRSEVYS